jgi:dCTP deaminase
VVQKYKVFTNVWGRTVDPKQFDPKSFVDADTDLRRSGSS